MNRYFVRYELGGSCPGAIRGTGHCSEGDLPANRSLVPGLGFMVGVGDLDSDYVDLSGAKPAIVPRPPAPAFDRLEILADGEESAVLRSPYPVTVFVDGIGDTVEAPDADGLFVYEFAADIAGVYRVEVEAFPCLRWLGEIIAI